MAKDIAKKDIEIGKRIHNRRIALKISQEKLGKALGVNKSTIQRYESQGVDPDKTMVLSAIAEELGTTIDWLKGETDYVDAEGFSTEKLKLEKSIQSFIESSSVNLKGVSKDLLVNYLKNVIDTLTVYNLYFAKAMEKIENIDDDETVATVIDKYDIERNVIVNSIYQKEVKDIIDDLHLLVDNLYSLFNGDDGLERFLNMQKIPANAKAKFEEKYSQKENVE